MSPLRTAVGVALGAVLGAGIAGVAAAEEPELRLDATNKLDYRRHDRGDVREEAFRNRLEVAGDRGPFSLWVRLESLQMSNRNVYDPFGVGGAELGEDVRVDRTEVTRRAFTFAGDSFRGTAGDFTYIFGRGLLFAAFEDEELNYDTRLDGVSAQLDHELGTLRALGGSDHGNRLRGVFAEPRAFGPVRVGAGFVEAWCRGVSTGVRIREQSAGGLAELTWGPGSLYGEYVHRAFPGTRESASEEAGHGGFVGGLVSVWDVTLSGEFRDYERFEHDYHDPPTALRQHTWTLLNRVNGSVQEDLDDDDVRGWLAEADWSAGLFTSVSASWSAAETRESDDDYWELYAELKTTWREKLFFALAGAESELTLGTLFDERIGGFGEIVAELDDVSSLTVGAEWNEVRLSDETTRAFRHPIEYRDQVFSLSYGRSPWLTLTGSLERTTDPAETSDNWFSVLAEVALAEHHDLQVSYGSERGGWKCAGGVCFFEPEFEGLKLRWIARY
jgi:hypothetical protein